MSTEQKTLNESITEIMDNAYNQGVEHAISIVEQRSISPEIFHYNASDNAKNVAKWEHEFIISKLKELKK